MSSTSQLTDFSDLYTDLINRVRAGTNVSSTVTQAKRYCNIGLHDMHLGFLEKLPWAERDAVLRTQSPYSTGTVTITQGSVTLTGASTAWNTNNSFSVANVRAGGKFTIAGSQQVYSVASVSSDTVLTLDQPFIDADVAAASYQYFEDEYALASDFLRPVDLHKFASDPAIELLPRNKFREYFPRNKTPGKPMYASIFDRGFESNTTPVRRIALAQPPDDEYLITYSYVTGNLAVSAAGAAQTSMSADTDEPIVPLNARHAIVYNGLAAWYRDKKDDNRASQAKQDFTDIMLRLLGSPEIAQSRPQIQPRRGIYVGKARTPWRGRSGRRFITGSAFDELRQ